MSELVEQYRKRIAQADARAGKLAQALISAGRHDDLFRAAEDTKYRDRLYKEFKIGS